MKMLNKKRGTAYLALVILTVLISVLAGCGTPAPTAAPTTAAEKPTATPAAAAEKPTDTPVAAEKPTDTPVPAPSRPGGTLTVGHPTDPTELNPHNTTAAYQSVFGQIVEQFVLFDTEKRGVKPWLITEWEWITDKTLRIKLREGVKFTNGEDWDAEAAKYSLDLLSEARGYSFWVGDSYDRTEIVDKYTVDLYVNRIAGSWLAILARGGFAFPPKYTQEVGLEEGFYNEPVGTGPYQLAEWVRDDHITLEANMDYWGGPPPMDEVIFRVIPEEAARMAALETGEVDLVTMISAGSAKRIESNPDLVLAQRRGLRMFGTFFDMTEDYPVNDKRVRQALNYAVDKEGVAKLYGGYAAPMSPQWLTPDTIGYNPDLEGMYDYDPQKAKELLAEAGYPDGFEATIKYTINRYPLDKEMGETVAGYLEAVGIKVNQGPLEYGEYSRQHREIDENPMGDMHQWGLLTPPDAFMTLILFRWNPDGPRPYRHFGPNPELDELLDKGGDATDPAERIEIYKRATEIMAEDPPCIFLIIPIDLYGVSRKVVNFEPRADQVLWLHDVYKE